MKKMICVQKKRSDFRLMLGGWYYTWRRYISWYTSDRTFALKCEKETYPIVCFSHKSLLKRNLTKEEEVYQENKVVNLRLAVKQLDKVIINPKETLSYWKIIGKPSAAKGYKKGMMLKMVRLYTALAEACVSCQIYCSGSRCIHRWRLSNGIATVMMYFRTLTGHSPLEAVLPAFIPMAI